MTQVGADRIVVGKGGAWGGVGGGGRLHACMDAHPLLHRGESSCSTRRAILCSGVDDWREAELALCLRTPISCNRSKDGRLVLVTVQLVSA